MRVFAVYTESFGEKELEKLFKTYDKARDYILGKEKFNGVMSIKELDVE